MYLSVILIVISLNAISATSKECHNQAMVTVVKKHLVQNYAFDQADGVYSDWWVQKIEKDTQKCSYIEFTKTGDGDITLKPTVFLKGVKEADKAEQYWTKTSTTGVFEAWGNAAGNHKYYGKAYVFYADENVKASYTCVLGSTSESFGIVIKNSKKQMLQSDEENEMKTSLTQAEAVMKAIFQEYKGHTLNMVHYDVEELCP